MKHNGEKRDNAFDDIPFLDDDITSDVSVPMDSSVISESAIDPDNIDHKRDSRGRFLPGDIGGPGRPRKPQPGPGKAGQQQARGEGSKIDLNGIDDDIVALKATLRRRLLASAETDSSASLAAVSQALQALEREYPKEQVDPVVNIITRFPLPGSPEEDYAAYRLVERAESSEKLVEKLQEQVKEQHREIKRLQRKLQGMPDPQEQLLPPPKIATTEEFAERGWDVERFAPHGGEGDSPGLLVREGGDDGWKSYDSIEAMISAV